MKIMHTMIRNRKKTKLSPKVKRRLTDEKDKLIIGSVFMRGIVSLCIW